VRQHAPKNKVKLVLNLCLIALAVIPRGGTITVTLTGEGESLEARVEANGANARLAHGIASLIAGSPESGSVDAHSIQAFYTGLVGRSCGLDVTVESEPESVTLHARAMVGSTAPVPA
jgi:histidine phosphotransferase ChpT